MSGTDIRSVGSSADILDSFLIKKRPATEQAPVVKEQTDISPQDNVQVSEKKADPKTKTNLDLVDKKTEDFQVLALPNEAGDGVGKFKVDPTGKPVADSEGNLIPDQNGKRLYIKADAEGKPIPGEDNNLQFVDYEAKVNPQQKDSGNIATISDPQTGKDLLFKVTPSGEPVFDEKGELIQDPNGSPLAVKVDTDGKFLLDEFNDPMFVNTKKMSKVPDKPIDLSAPAETTQKENSKMLTLEDVSPIASLEHPDQIGTFKVDDAGLPIFGEDGRPIEDPNGQQVYAQIDKEGNMMTDPTGKPVFVSPDNVESLSTQRKVNKAIDTHAAKRIALPSTWRLPLIGVPKFVAGKLITGMSMKIPFTGGKVIGFGVKNAVATAVHAELATLKVSKTIGSQIGKAVSSGVVEKLAEKPGLVKSLFAQFGSKTAAATEKALVKTTEKVTADLATKGLSNATVNTTEGIVKALTKEGALGKGIAPVKTMYEAGKEGTVSLIKGLFKKGGEEAVEATVKAGAETVSKTAAKVGSKTAAKTGAKVSTKVAVETTEKAALKFTEGYAKATIGAGEVVLKESVTKGVEKGIKLAVSRSSKEVGEKLISETAQKTIQKAAEKAAVEATGKGTAKAGVTLAKVTHHIGTGINAAITVYDTYDAYKKFKDPNVTGISKALATTTVVLDGVSTYYSAKGVGGWKSWVATGGSMITSIASDYTKYKK